MKNLKKALCLLVAVLMILTVFSACGSKQDATGQDKGDTQSQQAGQEQKDSEKPKEVTLTYLNCWNGSSVVAPRDPVNNPVAIALKEKTGVTLEVEYATTAENEKLNLIFATGDMPDIINGPFWGGVDIHTHIFKKAAKEGLLLPLDEYVEKHSPFLKQALTTAVAQDFLENDLEDPEFGGKHYFLPWQTARTEEDVVNWAHNVFARKDILEALNVDPSDIKHSEDLYELLKKIRDGNFKDINGNQVIPAGAWANGWVYSALYNSYNENTLTDEFTKIDGKFRHIMFSPLIDKQVLFMRKLVSEGLFDVEAFKQNDSTAKEKMAAGKIAVFGAHYPHVKQFFETTLYKDHPEMEYVPIGPILNAKGEQVQVGQTQLDGRAGTPIICLSKTCKDPDAAIKFIDYINSEEGLKLVCYGIEGVHYNLVDGKPRLTKEWLEKWRSDPQALRDEGIQSIYTWFITLDNRLSNWGESSPGDAEQKDEKYELAKKVSPLKFVKGFRVNYFRNQYKDIEKIDSMTSIDVRGDIMQKSFFAKSDEEALSILNGFREQLIKGGIEDYENFINEMAATRDDIIW